MKLRRRILSCFLSFAVAVTMMCGLFVVEIGAYKTYSNTEITNILTEWKTSKYKHGEIDESTKGYNSTYLGSQCYAFARKLGDELFGSFPNSIYGASNGTIQNGWKAMKNADEIVLEPGDIVRVGTDGNHGHTAMVWKVNGDHVEFVQSLGSLGNEIYWGEFYASSSYGGKQTSEYEILHNSLFSGVWKHPGATNSKTSNINIGTNFAAYIVNTASGNYLTAEVGGNVDSRTKTEDYNQRWWFDRTEDGSYIIYNCYYGLLDSGNDSTTLYVHSDQNNDYQRWYISGEPGAYVLRSKASGNKVIDIENGSAEDGANAQMFESNDTGAQKFTIKFASSPNIGALAGVYMFSERDLCYTSPVMTGDDIRCLQICLNILGISCEVDGSFGPATKQAVIEFQSRYGLTQDGSCGPQTKSKIIEAVRPTGLTIAAGSTNIAPGTSTNITVTPKDNRVIRNYIFYVTHPSGHTDTFYRHGDNVFVFYPKQGKGTYSIKCDIQNECGNYNSNEYVTITVDDLKTDIANVNIAAIEDQMYTGSEIKPEVILTDGNYILENNKDYTVAYSVNTNAGTATVTITGKGNYTGTTTATFKIVAVATAPEVTAEAGDGQVTLSWEAVPGATKYAISKYENKKYIEINYNYTGTTITITGLTNGTTYKFLVQAYVNGSWSKFTTTDLISVKPASTKPQVTATAGDGKVTLAWNAVPGATKYAISKYENKKYIEINYNYTGTAITITGLTNGTTYKFLVQAYVDGSWSKFTTADLVSAMPTGGTKPQVKATAGDGKVTLSWEAVPGATKYAISKYENKKYIEINYNYTGTAITITGLTNGTTYKFLVQAYVDGSWSKFTTSDLVSAKPVGGTKPQVTATPDNGQVILKWDAIDGATKYAISRYENNKYIEVNYNVTETTYKVTGLTNGKTYKFLVQAYVNGSWSKFTTADFVTASPSAKPQVAATARDGKVTLKWNAITGATKYAISRYENGKYIEVDYDYTGTSCTLMGLNNGTEYKFLVQAYVNGSWSTFSSADLVSVTPKA